MRNLLSKLQIALRIDQPIRLVWQSAPGWTLANLALVVVQGILPIAALYLLKQIIDTVSAAVTLGGTAEALQRTLMWIALAAGVAVTIEVCKSLAEYASQVQSLAVTDHVSDLLHAKSIEVDLEYYEDANYQDTLHRAQQEAPYRPTQIVNGLVNVVQSSLSLIGVAVLLFSYNWALTLALVVVTIPGAVVRLLYARKLFQYDQKNTQNERKGWYYHWILTNPEYAKEVRLFNLGDLFRGRHRSLREALREGRLALARRRVVLDVGVQILVTVSVFGALAVVASQVIQGDLQLGGLVMYYQGFQLGINSLQAVLGGLTGLYENNLFLSNYYRFLGVETRLTAPQKSVEVPRINAKGVHFSGVDFAYPNNGRRVLHGIEMEIAPGEVIALVGANGSGKTTLIKLLCRLYDPTLGSITCDGINLRDLDPVQWRRQISVVFQDYIQYQATAAENIWIGDVDQPLALEPIQKAAKLSGADAVIRELPQGYDTVLGNWFDNGRELSQGEWQKIALARAFKRDARIVVLDEPTSSLDPLAEAEVFKQFRQLMHGHTAILISHRFSTVRLADRIYVMDHGQIIEHGTHAELMQIDGKYAQLYRVQAENYM